MDLLEKAHDTRMARQSVRMNTYRHRRGEERCEDVVG